MCAFNMHMMGHSCIDQILIFCSISVSGISGIGSLCGVAKLEVLLLGFGQLVQ